MNISVHRKRSDKRADSKCYVRDIPEAEKYTRALKGRKKSALVFLSPSEQRAMLRISVDRCVEPVQ